MLYLKLSMRCPNCGHDAMHYGEPVELRDKLRDDVFSCRGCGSAIDVEDIEDIVRGYIDALANVRKAVAREM